MNTEAHAQLQALEAKVDDLRQDAYKIIDALLHIGDLAI